MPAASACTRINLELLVKVGSFFTATPQPGKEKIPGGLGGRPKFCQVARFYQRQKHQNFEFHLIPPCVAREEILKENSGAIN